MSPESVLRPRRDICWQLLATSPRHGRRSWSAFDPISRTSYRCGDTEAWLFRQFDGRRSLQCILSESSRAESPIDISLTEFVALARMLVARGLAHCDEGALAAPMPPRRAATAALRLLQSSVSWRLRGINPDRWLQALSPHTDALFSGRAVMTWAALACGVACFVLADFTRLSQQATLWQWLMQPSSGASLFVVFVITRAIHELGHALVLTRLGGRCPDIGVIFMLGAPCVYCDVTESWRLPSAWHRAAVAAGGMYAEMIVATLSGFLWLTTTDGFANTLALQTMIVCSISTLLININPLMRFDGYYLLSDALDEPNLRFKADQILMDITKRAVLGQPPESHQAVLSRQTESTLNQPQRERVAIDARRWALAAFSLAGVTYRLSLALVMATLVANLYAAWNLLWVGRGVALGLLLTWWVLPAMKLVTTLLRNSSGAWQRCRLAALAAWVVLVVCAVPLPCRQYATGWIQPERMQGLYAPTTARLISVHKTAGQRVEAGQIVFELSREPGQMRAIEMAHIAKKGQARLSALSRRRYYGQDIDLLPLQTHLAAAAVQVEHALQAVERQSVRGSFSGRLISSPALPAIEVGAHTASSAARLWLSDDQVGRYVPAGTMLAAVCSDDQFAVLPLEDDQLQTISVGTPVNLRIPALGDQVWPSEVAAIVRTEQLDSIARLVAEQTFITSGVSASLPNAPYASGLKGPSGNSTDGSASPIAVGSVGAGSSKGVSAGYAAIVRVPKLDAHVGTEVRAAFRVPPVTLAARISQWARANSRWLTQ